MSLVTLYLHVSTFQHVENLVMTQSMMDGANIVADTVGSLPFLKNLYMFYDSDQPLVVPILTHFVNRATASSHKKLGIVLCESWVQVCNALVSVLQLSTPLEELYMYVRPVDNTNRDAVSAVFPVLQGHTTLQRLKIFIAPDSDKGAARVAAMLRHNESITCLRFPCYSLVGLSTVIEALGTNSSVQKLYIELLNLHDEALSSEGGRRLINLLPQTRHLKVMRFVTKSNDRWGKGVQADVLCALKLNTSLTSVNIDWLGANSDAQTTIEYYTTRNKFGPQLASVSKAYLPTIFASALVDHGNAGLSVIFDTLCARADWYDTADVPNRKTPLTTSVSDGGSSAKRARVTTTK